MTTFAERLKNAMEQANMSQSALSEQAGASKAAISQYLSGKNTPGPDRIKALADATGVSFDYLMGYAEVDGIGRHCGFKIRCRKACGFKSHLQHHFSERRFHHG